MATDSATLISSLGLQTHPAGGYFLETDRRKTEIPTPFRDDAAPRNLATTIYYLLTKQSPTGIILREKSVAYHMHHLGRMEYTLITPASTPERAPKIEKKVLGPENRLIVVEPGVWKFARLLEGEENCLMTMLLVPGFSLEDHEFLTMDSLKALFEGAEGGEERIKEFEAYTWKN